MASHRAPARALVLLAAAFIAATPLASGLTAFVPPAPVQAVDPEYPDFLGIQFFGDGFNFGAWPATAGLVNFKAAPDSGPAAPTAAQVAAFAGGQPLQGTAILRADLAETPLATTRLVDLALEDLPVEIPLSTIPFQRSIAPTSWSGLVATTALAGIPLQSVTYGQVRALPAVQAQLQLVKVGEVDWSRSLLADLPLAALTFEGQPVTAIDIPLQPGEPVTDTTNAQRWCYLLNTAQPGSCPSPASLAGKSLIELSLQGAPLKNIPLKNIPLKNIDLSASPLKNIPLKNIVLEVSPLKNIPLKNIDMAGAPLKNIPLKNILLDAAGNPTASPLKNIPLKNIAWATSPLKNIPLKNIDLATSPLKNIPLKNIDFANAPLKNIPLKNIDLATSPLKNIPLKNIAFAVAPLKNIPLKNIDLATSPLKNIPLKNIAAAGAPLKNIPLKNIAWDVAPLKNIPLKNIDLTTSGLAGVPLGSIAWSASPIGTRLASDFTTAGVPFASVPAAGATLAQVAAANGFTAAATLGNLAGALLAGRPDILLADLRLDLAGATAPAIALEALLNALQAAGATPAPNPPLSDLRADLVAGSPTLGDLRLDLLADTGVTVGDLLAVLLPAQADVLLGDLRLDLAASAPATTISELLAILLPAQPDILLGDLRLDLAAGVDTLVLDAITAFLLDPATFAPYLLGALGTWTDISGHDITLGELGIWTDAGGDITLGQLAQYLDDSVSLADVLLGLVPPEDFPFENFPVSSLDFNASGRQILVPVGWGSNQFRTADPVFSRYRFLSTHPTNDTEPVLLVVYLAPGSVVESATSPNGPTFLPDITTMPDGRLRVPIPIPPMPPNSLAHATLTYVDDVRTGLHPATAEIYDASGNLLETGANARDIIDGAEPDTPIETIAQATVPGFVRTPVLPVNAEGCSASDASCVGRDPGYVDAMLPGFISFPGDVDWFRIPNVRAGARITADLTNLPLDADLVLYGPAGISNAPTVFPSAQDLPGRYVEDAGLGVGRAATAVAAEALNDLNLDQGYHDPFIGEFGTDVPALTPLSISQHHGTDPESIGVIAPVNGDYVIQVSGYNGQEADDPYLVRARVFTPTSESTCAARSFPNPTPAPGAAPLIAPDVNTVFLTNPSRLSATYGATEADAVATRLAGIVSYLDAHPALNLKAAVVPVDAYLAAGPTNPYTIWDANPCSISGANGVASAITGVLQTVRGAAPGVAYVTLVGGDDILPMGRTPDLTRVANEADYASTFATENPISAAAAAGYLLTDDAYGDTHPTTIGDGNTLFVPRLAVGRLVETPSEINALLQAYADDADGKLDTGTGMVAGYDFLADAADIVKDRLTTGGRTVDGTLIDHPQAADPWTSSDLLAELFPTGGPSPLIASVNAHYDHTALLPSAGNTGADGDLLTASEVLGASSVDKLLNRLLFTMGCHAGLAVPDAYVPGTGADLDTLRLDWAQALAQAKVAVYVANTGFGVGDTSSVAYSERLMGLYARLLDGNLSVGQALAFAKQAYYGSLGAVGVYDFKILQQTAFYGLPFWKVSTGTVPTPPPAPILPGTVLPDLQTGLQAMSFAVSPSLQQSPASAFGRYWFVNGFDPQVTHYRPIAPRMTFPVGTAGQTARGVLITSLTSHDVVLNPVVSTPTIDLSASTPEAPIGDTAWPARPATVTTYQAPFGTAQDLVLVPGQFFGSPTGGNGTQRLFDTVGLKVYYAAPAATDFDPATILSTRGVPSGSSIAFTVHTSDAAGAVARVLVAFHDPDGSWTFVDLAHGSGDTWTGNGTANAALPTGADVEYFVQVLDAAGNVAFASNKAQLFAASVADTSPPTITASVSPAANAAGWIGGSATVTFACSDVDSGIPAGSCPTPVLVTADGTTVVTGTVFDAAGNQATAYAPVQVDRTAPSITASVMPSGWASASSATVTFSCSDAASGLDAAGCPAPVTVTAEGTTDVPGSVHDVAGNSASVTATVRLDRTAPLVTVVPGPGNARVCSTADPLSGVAAQATGSSTSAKVNGILTTTLVCSGATDNAGNVAPTVTETYVVPFTFIGFQPPVDNAPTPNTGNAGRTYPIKFQLKDQQGAFITVLPAVISTTYKTGASCSGLGDALETTSTGSSSLSFNPATNTFQYNWKTPNTKGCYEFRLALADGTTRVATFNLK